MNRIFKFFIAVIVFSTNLIFSAPLPLRAGQKRGPVQPMQEQAPVEKPLIEEILEASQPGMQEEAIVETVPELPAIPMPEERVPETRAPQTPSVPDLQPIPVKPAQKPALPQPAPKPAPKQVPKKLPEPKPMPAPTQPAAKPAPQMPAIPEPTPQEAKELEKQLDQAQKEIAKGAVSNEPADKVTQAKRFIANAKELSACYAPRFFGGKSCDNAKKDRLKAELRAQLPTMDKQMLIKLGLSAAALAATIGLIWAGTKQLQQKKMDEVLSLNHPFWDIMKKGNKEEIKRAVRSLTLRELRGLLQFATPIANDIIASEITDRTTSDPRFRVRDSFNVGSDGELVALDSGTDISVQELKDLTQIAQNSKTLDAFEAQILNKMRTWNPVKKQRVLNDFLNKINDIVLYRPPVPFTNRDLEVRVKSMKIKPEFGGQG